MDKTVIFLIGIIVVIVLISLQHDQKEHEEIKFLEKALATKTLHYEWLVEIVESQMANGNSEIKEKFEEILKNRKYQPKF